ncbi:MAG: hypothetical protein GC172_13500 [Phycisphaera sp.]|nr:hypothetical protein [Phycisphaera sp.]
MNSSRRGALRHSAARKVRGGILLELLVAIAIFAAGAALTLSALQSALDGVRRAELRARAEDLAASRLAELDAGLVSIGDLGDSDDGDHSQDDGDADALAVTIEILPAPGAARGSALSLARATVRMRADAAAGADGAVLAVAERVVRTSEGAR